MGLFVTFEGVEGRKTLINRLYEMTQRVIPCSRRASRGTNLG